MLIDTLLREIFIGFGIIGGVIATILTALTALKKENAAQIARTKELKDKKDSDDVELTSRLQELSKDLLTQMDYRLKEMELELKISRKREILLRESGLRLIRGIEASIVARSHSQQREGGLCGACLTGDEALLKEVLLVRALFEKENETNGI